MNRISFLPLIRPAFKHINISIPISLLPIINTRPPPPFMIYTHIFAMGCTPRRASPYGSHPLMGKCQQRTASLLQLRIIFFFQHHPPLHLNPLYQKLTLDRILGRDLYIRKWIFLSLFSGSAHCTIETRDF